ncbi:secreted RxLR effector peptide protein, putative [Phytophthora infestans T30-4]|uniref:Secreted RxLR effector peptide protein, putative n=1 Tax=Phytophthora infestans (strain T30-4) TaxID=403677 RepID=D0N0Q6_PHYIT|nr:secreted RxLR effector peptide protein, putative [Phytophthora infestans T30-4]EEY67219.1 secreted RxLR effector peptide protein, putative [Phytophthora infestans T30-4]|eukprot:XP_002905867.1 secreted RxLR effector peptide protein, putative [Phytophthora infestans T30-4]
MRFTLLLLFTASSALLAWGSTLSIENDGETRSLRQTKLVVSDDAQDKERGLIFDASDLTALKSFKTVNITGWQLTRNIREQFSLPGNRR